MSGLALVAALAAQAATQTGAPPSASSAAPVDTTVAEKHIGSTNYIDLEAGVGYSSNPLLTFDDSGGAGYGRISGHAVHTRISERSTTVLSGFGQALFYTQHYGAEQSFELNGRHDTAVSENLRLFIDADAAYDKGGQLDRQILTVPNVPLLPGTTVPPVLLPPGTDFLSVTGRSYRFRADAGGQLQVSARDSLDFSSGIAHDILKSGGFETRYTSVPVSLGFGRQVSSRTRLGARLAGQFTHYSGDLSARNGDSTVITPQVTAQIQLAPQLTFSGAAGPSFSSVDNSVRTRHSTGIGADANLCSQNERSTICGRASVQQEAATSAGPAQVVSLGVDYSRRLTADDTLQVALSAERYSNPTILVTGEAFNHATYARAVVNYSRKIGDRWFGGINLSARKIAETGPDPDADLAASLFIRYRFGDVQ